MRQPDGPTPGTEPNAAPSATDQPPAAPTDEVPGAPIDEKLEASLRPIKRKDFGYEQARHLLWRAGLGGNEKQVRYLADIGPEKAVDLLVNYKPSDFAWPGEREFDPDIMRPPSEQERQAYRMAQRNQDEETLARLRLERERRERDDRAQITQVQKWWLARMIETPNPLEEKMTLFWHGLLATNYRTIENSYHMFLQNQTFRKHAVGSYADLLKALIRDPAMLAYLDNNDSRKNRPNENLAREIMELFSLGVGNYTEQDIKEGARALTGYTFRDDEFVLEKDNHDTGKKTILGQTGNWDGDDFVRIILSQPACPRYISRRLYHHFVADVPPDERGGDKGLDPAQRAVLRQMAISLSGGKYELKPVLRKLFLSEHFYEPRFMNDQIKSPVQLVVGACRSLDTPVRDLSILNDAMDLMGQRLMFPPSVKGWEGGRAWINTSTYYVRQNTLAFLIAGKRPRGYDPTARTQTYDAMALLTPYGKDSPVGRGEPRAVAEALLRLALGWAPSAGVAELLAFLGSNENAVNNETVSGMLLLISAMPEYQLC
ncbi:MAG: DUF1800 domain-containing protein [Planctomycetota bacterium]|nr:DUF1800 domain-containing protein [Planctomycetota bacterium]